MGDLTKLKELGVENYVDRWSKYVSTRAGASCGAQQQQQQLRCCHAAGDCSLCLLLLQDATELKDKLTGSSRAAIVTSADGLLHQVGVC